MSTNIAILMLLLSFTGAMAMASDNGCTYEGKKYAPGDTVPMSERCLSCRCGSTGGAPVCRLQVCPQLPVPPPRDCILVHRRNECCQRLVCDTPPVPSGHPDTDGRNSPSRIQAENFDIAPAESGCVVNGTRYGEGSATDSSSLCEYCYCVRGQQRCVKPQCEMPLPGCTPRYRSLACCPVSYDCTTKPELSTTPAHVSTASTSTTSTTRAPPRVTGCMVDGARHADGAQVRSLAGDCERCYCLRNSIRCITLECAPPLMGCSPVFAPGRCCPVQYNCSRIITEPAYRERQENDVSDLLQLADGDRAVGYGSLVADLRRHREMAENASSTDSTETPTVTTEHQETATVPLDQVSTTQLPTVDTVSKTEEANLEARTDPPETTDSPNTQVTEEMEMTTIDTTVVTETTQAPTTTTKAPTTKRPASTKSPAKVTTKAPTSSKAPASSKAPSTVKATTKISTTKSPPSTKAPASTSKSPASTSKSPASTTKSPASTTKQTTTQAPTTTPSTTTTEVTTTLESSTTLELIDRVDNLDTLQEETTMETSTSPKPTTTTTISPILEMLEALMFNKNKHEASPEDEYGQALPPSLPNITMIPFLPEDAVVDKKKDQYTSTESYYKGAPSVQRFSPPELVSGFVPRQPPQLDESAQFYQTSPQPDSSDILTAPQASPLSAASLISITTPSPEGSMDSITVGSTITLANPVLALTGGHRACISPDGREVAHGERMASPGPCEECRCDHGTVLCHEEPTCIALTTGVEKEADKRIDHDTATLSPSLSAVPVLPAPENVIGEEESSLSFDSLFDFLFQGAGELPQTSQRPQAQTTPTPTMPPPAIPARPLIPQRKHSAPSPSLPPSLASMLKVSGCNIYGRMYRVGRIISELSGPCRECMCTEMGVQCQSLGC